MEPRNKVFETICKGNFKLKHVETKDKTKPQFDKEYKDFRLKRHVSRKPMLDEIRRGRRLKHVEKTNDKTKLQIEKGFRLRKNNRDALFKEINRGGFKLKRVSKTNDRSAPMFERYGKVPIPKDLLKDVTKGGTTKKLHHVDTVDKSKPKIEKDVKIKKYDRKPLLGELTEGIDLKHVETTDKAKPVIPRNFHLTKVERDPKMMEERRRLDMEKGKGVKKPTSAATTSGSQKKTTKFI